MVNPITGRAHVYYSQNIYDTYEEAVASISIDEFVESDATAYSYVFSSYLIVKGNTTDLTNGVTVVNDGSGNPTRVTLISLQIYNRNGILMFSTNKISEGWDGRYKGVMQDMGIYFVKLITLENGLETPTPRLYLFK